MKDLYDKLEQAQAKISESIDTFEIEKRNQTSISNTIGYKEKEKSEAEAKIKRLEEEIPKDYEALQKQEELTNNLEKKVESLEEAKNRLPTTELHEAAKALDERNSNYQTALSSGEKKHNKSIEEAEKKKLDAIAKLNNPEAVTAQQIITLYENLDSENPFKTSMTDSYHKAKTVVEKIQEEVSKLGDVVPFPKLFEEEIDAGLIIRRDGERQWLTLSVYEKDHSRDLNGAAVESVLDVTLANGYKPKSSTFGGLVRFRTEGDYQTLVTLLKENSPRDLARAQVNWHIYEHHHLLEKETLEKPEIKEAWVSYAESQAITGVRPQHFSSKRKTFHGTIKEDISDPRMPYHFKVSELMNWAQKMYQNLLGPITLYDFEGAIDYIVKNLERKNLPADRQRCHREMDNTGLMGLTKEFVGSSYGDFVEQGKAITNYGLHSFRILHQLKVGLDVRGDNVGLPVEDVAYLLEINPKTVKVWVDNHKLDTIGGYVSKDSIEKYVTNHPQSINGKHISRTRKK